MLEEIEFLILMIKKKLLELLKNQIEKKLLKLDRNLNKKTQNTLEVPSKEEKDQEENATFALTNNTTSAEQGSKIKSSIRTYYINKICYDDNIYIIFLDYNQRTKTLVEGNFKIIAVGEKLIKETEEIKEEISNSYNSDNENSIDSNSKDDDNLLWLELLYWCNNWNSENASNNSKESNPELITAILKEMVECTD